MTEHPPAETAADHRPRGSGRTGRYQPALVVVANPPWRERAHGQAPWVEARRDRAAGTADMTGRPSMDEFRSPAQVKRAGKLANLWTFFWRWAVWRVFDANPDGCPGVAALITPSVWLYAPTHEGMRSYLRQTADEGYVVDLSPEGFRPDTSTRVFPGVQHPICLGVFTRHGPPRRDTPARVRHTTMAGTRQRKLEQLQALRPPASTAAERADASNPSSEERHRDPS